MARKKMTKSHSLRMHARMRARQHYGLIVVDLDSAIARIKKGDSRYVGSQSRARSVHIVNINGVGRDKKEREIAVKVVYDRERHQIITILPPSSLDESVH